MRQGITTIIVGQNRFSHYPLHGYFAGRTLGEAAIARETGVNVLGLVTVGGGPMLTNPVPESQLEPGDVLIGFGTCEQLEKLGGLAGRAGERWWPATVQRVGRRSITAIQPSPIPPTATLPTG